MLRDVTPVELILDPQYTPPEGTGWGVIRNATLSGDDQERVAAFMADPPAGLRLADCQQDERGLHSRAQ